MARDEIGQDHGGRAAAGRVNCRASGKRPSSRLVEQHADPARCRVVVGHHDIVFGIAIDQSHRNGHRVLVDPRSRSGIVNRGRGSRLSPVALRIRIQGAEDIPNRISELGGLIRIAGLHRVRLEGTGFEIVPADGDLAVIIRVDQELRVVILELRGVRIEVGIVAIIRIDVREAAGQ